MKKVCNLPEDGIDKTIVSVEEGYKGSSKDLYYRSIGVTYEASRLSRRKRAWGCRPCLKLEDGCTLTLDNKTLTVATTPKTTNVVLHSVRLVPEARHTWNARNSLPGFCAGLSVRKKHYWTGIRRGEGREFG